MGYCTEAQSCCKVAVETQINEEHTPVRIVLTTSSRLSKWQQEKPFHMIDTELIVYYEVVMVSMIQ